MIGFIAALVFLSAPATMIYAIWTGEWRPFLTCVAVASTLIIVWLGRDV